MDRYEKVTKILAERFGCDNLISLATASGGKPHVRIVNGYYQDGAFYSVTYALSNKVQQIKNNPDVAVCGEWFTAHGSAENMGYVGNESNLLIMEKLREVFYQWYNKGHVDEADINTCLLCIRLIEGTLFDNGIRYVIDFSKKKITIFSDKQNEEN